MRRVGARLGQEFVQIIIAAVKFHEPAPIYCAAWVAELVNELFGESVYDFAALVVKCFIVFFGAVANRLNNVGIP